MIHGTEKEVFVFPASFAQQRLWLLNQLEPGSTAYNMPWVIRVGGALDVGALEQTLNAIVARHESLRTTFVSEDGSPMQVIAERGAVALPVTDLRQLPEAKREAEAMRLATEEAQQTFDLASGPLMRAGLLRLGEAEHILLLIIHHVIFDEWSADVLFQEIATLYESFATGRPSPLPSLPIQYADYAQWQREWLQGGVLDEQLAYWKRQLGGAPAVLELPTDRPRPAVQSYRGAHQSLTLSPDLTRAFKAFGQREGATLFMTLLAAYQTLLARYTGQDDIVIGTATAGRNRAEIEGLIGFFVNTLVLRTDLSGDPTFRELLGRVREVALGAYAHQDLPFEKLVEELQPERNIGRTPLFQVGFAIQHAAAPPREFAGLTLSPVKVEWKTAKVDLVLLAADTEQGLVITFEYNTDLFDAATIARMLGHFQTLLEGIAADPAERLSRLPLLTPPERHQVLVEWSGTKTNRPQEQCVHQLFEAQVERAPDSIAVAFEDQQLTYAELNRRANQLAHYLRKHGVGPEVLVGICVERSAEMIVGLLGILKAGGAYVPLDPAYPQERLSFMLEDTRAVVLLTEAELVKSLPEHKAKIVCLDTDWEIVAEESEENPQSGVTTENLAYVIYTSGSTGKPKGVLIPHQALVNYTETASAEFVPGAEDRVLQFASISFDASAEEIYPCLTRGATLVLRTDYMLGSTAEFWQKCEEWQLTVLDLPTAYWHEITARLGAERLTVPSSLRLVIIGGEKVLPARVATWQKEIGERVRLINTYGPTEATIVATMYEVSGRPEADSEGREVPIGRAVRNVQTYVLDRYLQPVPVGVPGELYIGGAGLARGYLNRPELTAERFIPHPFDAKTGARIYRTGDLVRYLPDGNLEYLGRADHQVKIRGFRVELGEIEAALNRHDAVQESILVLREEGEAGNKQLIAYVVPNLEYDEQDEQDEQAAGAEEPTGRVAQWEAIFDDLYGEVNYDQKPKFYVKGWDSSYTNQSMPDEEVQEWMEHTVGRILALKPTRVREIGCGGSGLMLFRIAPSCEEYCATDVSENAIHILQHQFDVLGQEIPGVTLLHRAADDFDDVAPGSYDALLIVSVAQYFPDIDYLLKVLERAAEAVRPGGFIFLGDMRSLPLLEPFHASVQLYRAPSSLSTAELKRRIHRQFSSEKQLTVDPNFFRAVKEHLPQIGAVKLQLLRGRYHNELTKFRYDVTLRIGAGSSPRPAVPWLDWQKENLTLESVRRLLVERGPEIQGIAGVPNARVLADLQIMKLLESDERPAKVGDLREALRESEPEGVDPEDLWALGDELPYAVDITWSDSAADGRYDVVFRRKTAGAHDEAVSLFREEHIRVKPWRDYANDPTRKIDARRLTTVLRNSLKEKLPEYMMPSHFVVLETLPLTPSGKVDRRALPAPDEVRPELEENYVAPQTPTEEALAGIWAAVLHIERVGVYDNFFELGGHSLLGTQVISRMRDRFGVELSLRTLFEEPTIAAMAKKIESARPTEESLQAPPLERVPRDGELPLSFAQQRLWFVDQLEHGSVAYNVPDAIRLTGRLNIAALEETLAALVARHESLRTTFATGTGGQPMQVIAPALSVPLPVTDLGSLPPLKRESEAERLVKEEAQRPFDLARGPLVRAHLLRLGPEDHILLLTLHHIISDGWSAGVLFREIGVLYEAFAEGRPSPLGELPIQYADYAAWQREWLQGEVLERQLAYWRKQLAGAPAVLKLPTDRPRPAEQSYRGSYQQQKMPKRVAEELKALSQREGATLFMSLVAAFQTLLYRYTDQADMIVGTDVAGRNRAEIEELIGFFLNHLVLRTDMSGDPTFRELLKRVKEVSLAAYEHQDVPFEKLVEALRPERSLSHTPIFQALFVLQNAPIEPLKLSGLTLAPLEFDSGVSKFDLALFMEEKEEEFVGIWVYKTDLFDHATITRMLGHFEILLGSILAEPDARLSALEINTETERKQRTVEKTERQESHLKKLKSIKRKTVDLSQVSSVKTDYLRPGETFPLVVQPNIDDVDLADWARSNREFIETNLSRHGALLFRGFQIDRVSEFERFALAICPELFGEYGDLPREDVGGKVYASTPYPADKAILFHNESSHMHRWPMKIWFHCVIAAEQGGETPLLDCRKTYELLDPRIRQRFAEKGVMYVRNYTDGLDVNWQHFFQTTDRSAVEDYCRRNSIDFEWKGEAGLRTRQVCQAVAEHPKTGEMVFFNQIQLHHVSCLDRGVRESLRAMFREEDLPRNCYYGDGSPIEDSVMQEIGELYDRTAASFPWQAGDIIMLDNMMIAHARAPFVGPRKIVVAMGEMIDKGDVEKSARAS